MAELIRWPIGKSILQKLGQKKYRHKFGLYYIEGTTSVMDAVRLKADIVTVLCDEERIEREAEIEAIQLIKENNIGCQYFDTIAMKKFSELTTPPSLIAVVRLEDEISPSIPPEGKLVLALDRVGDPGNVGTLLRSAAFYGVEEVWLGQGTADCYNQKVIRAAMSAHLHLKVAINVNLESILKEARANDIDVAVTLLDNGTEPETLSESANPLILVLGNEPHGVSETIIELANKRYFIARKGPVDSLNVAMAGTIFIDRLLR
jgi:RNA methyltransferase, TrmH family